MALEKNLFAIAPRLFTANGEVAGKVTVPNACDFKVKQKVKVSGTALPQLDLEVKRVISDTEMFLGPQSPPISDRSDLSAYTTAASPFVYAIEQKRPSIPFEESTRAVYEEEPTVAWRNILVDKCGDFYSPENPFPVQLSDGSINIGTVNAELEVQLSHEDNVPDAGDVADSVQVGDGTEILLINPDGSINVVFSPFPSGGVTPKSIYAEVSSVASATITTVATYTVPVGKKATLERISMSGQNIATYTAEVNAVAVDKKRTWFNGPMSEEMNFITSSGGSIQLVAGDIVRLRVIHGRPMVADFNARIDIIEIG